MRLFLGYFPAILFNSAFNWFPYAFWVVCGLWRCRKLWSAFNHSQAVLCWAGRNIFENFYQIPWRAHV